MININYNINKNEIIFKGHATDDTTGTVCTAASMIFYTLSGALRKCPKTWFKDNLDMHDSITDKKGKSYIKWNPEDEYEPYVLLIVQAIVTGFELLQDEYPKDVNFKVIK